METLEQILRMHAEKYPLMEPTDGVKLIYQNVFGGGHLIRDPEACRRMLRQEYAATPQVPGAALTEPIGNGMVRVMLRALEENGWEADRLCDIFIRSSRAHQGTREEFLEKLDLLRALTREGIFRFGTAELESYLEAYRAAGYPMVSHSPRFREAYRPAYRIVVEAFFNTKP